MSTTITTAFIAIISLFAINIWYIFRQAEDKKLPWTSRLFGFLSIKSSEKQAVGLNELRQLWTKEHEKKKTTIYVEELCKIWVQTNNTSSQKDSGTQGVEFSTPEVFEFHTRVVAANSFLRGRAGAVVTEILSILDKEGSCSSIVSAQGKSEIREPEINEYGKDHYDILGKVSLVKHTLNVADEILKIVTPGPASVKALIAALGHDLGKLPSSREEGKYSIGDHPVLSTVVLDQIEDFLSLSYAKEIKTVIRDHHRQPKEADHLGWMLHDADRAARAKELAEKLKELKENRKASETVSDEKETAVKTALPPSSKPKDILGPEELELVPSVNEKQDTSNKPKEPMVLRDIDVSDWFSSPVLLKLLNPIINEINDTYFKGFSMPDGSVYIMVAPVWEAIKKMAMQRGVTSVAIAEGDMNARRNILLAVKRELCRDNAIIESMLSEEFFFTYFRVEIESHKGFPNAQYIPFRAEAFGESASSLEKRKKGFLKQIKSVIPKAGPKKRKRKDDVEDE